MINYAIFLQNGHAQQLGQRQHPPVKLVCVFFKKHKRNLQQFVPNTKKGNTKLKSDENKPTLLLFKML